MSDFSHLLERMWKASTNLNAKVGMSMPNHNTMQMYGPLTDRITKDKSVRCGQQFYDTYLRNQNGTKYWTEFNKLTNTIEDVTNIATPGAEGSILAISQRQKYCISALDQVIRETNEKDGTRVRNGLLAAADIMIVQSLSFIPIAGPIISVAVCAATAGIASAALDSPNSSAGIMTLCYLGAKKLREDTTEYLNVNALHANKPFIAMHQHITQNQVAADKLGNLGLIDPNIKMKKILDESKVNFSKLDKLMKDEEQTLKKFQLRIDEVFSAACSLLTNLINASVIESFDDQTKKFTLNPEHNTPKHRLALLIIGYFYAKDWHDEVEFHRQEAIADSSKARTYKKVAAAFEKSPNPRYYPMGKLEMVAIKANDITAGPSAKGVFTAARNSLSKKTLRQQGADPRKSFPDDVDPNFYMLERFVIQGQSYITNVKKALTSDIETILTRSNAGNSMNKEDYLQMWRLYTGAMLIVNHALKCDARDRRRLDEISAPNIPSNYVKLVERADFVATYRTWLGVVNEDKKYELAETGKIRYAANPSDAEISMLVLFCTVVVYSVDIGKISLGYQSWTTVKDHLVETCKSISATRLTKANADRLLKKNNRDRSSQGDE